MRKLVIKFCAILFAIGVIILVPSVCIDPYNVFHASSPRDNGIESNKSFIKTEYIKKNYSDFDGLVFGSSRAGFLDVSYLNEKTGGHFYNMASSESLVSEQTLQLKELIRAGFVPKRVFLMVDDISCFVDPRLHENMLYRVPYPGENPIDRLEFYLKYCDLITNIKSLDVIREHSEKVKAEMAAGIDSSYDSKTGLSYLDRFFTTGTERLDKPSQFDPDAEMSKKGYWVDYYSYRVDEALSDMQEMVDLCAKHGIELTVVTNPLYKLTYEMDLEFGYEDYLAGLREITDYYNFSAFSEVTCDYTYYYETSHFTPEVTRMMIDAIYDKDAEAISKLSDKDGNSNIFVKRYE